jgi:hypothetical protein
MESTHNFELANTSCWQNSFVQLLLWPCFNFRHCKDIYYKRDCRYGLGLFEDTVLMFSRKDASNKRNGSWPTHKPGITWMKITCMNNGITNNVLKLLINVKVTSVIHQKYQVKKHKYGFPCQEWIKFLQQNMKINSDKIHLLESLSFQLILASNCKSEHTLLG